MSKADQFINSAAYQDFKYFTLAMMPDYILANHNRLICKKLMDLESGKIKRLMINVAPRSGKSKLISEFFPAWFLGRHPDLHVICATYGQSLADTFGRKVRNTIKDEKYNLIFPNTKLSDDSSAIKKFDISQGGGYYATGVGGPLTGRGGDCVTGDTLVETEFGPRKISDIFQCQYFGRVLSFNHEKNIYEYKHIQSYRRISQKQIITIQTARGRSIRVTPEHKIYVNGKGYIEAASLRPGDELVFQPSAHMSLLPKRILENTIRFVKRNKARLQNFLLFQIMSIGSSIACKKEKMQSLFGFTSNGSWELLFKGVQRKGKSSIYSYTALRLLPQNVYKEKIRFCQIREKRTPRSLLLNSMFSEPSCNKKQKELRVVQEPCSKKNDEILLGQMSSREGKDLFNVPNLQNNIRENENSSCALQPEVCRPNAQQKYEGKWEFKLSAWERSKGYIQENKSSYQRERWEPMCDLSINNKDTNPSYRSRQIQRFARKLNNALSVLSFTPSQVEYDTVSSVERDCSTKHDVYDIQVEGNHNFFANGILVHNCIIIDDPIKNRSDANSQTIKRNLIDWFQSTLYTRLSPTGSICLIQTRWAQDDLSGYLLANEPENWEVINIPAISEEGESYWPERWPVDKLLDIKKTIGIYEFSALYQQSPAPRNEGMFQRQWFDVVDAVPSKVQRVRGWDRAASVPKNGSDPDWTVGVKMAKDGDGILYIEDMVRFRGSSLEVQNAIKNTAARDGFTCKIILEQDPGQAGKSEAEYLIRLLQGFNVRAEKVSKDKVTRAGPFSAQCEAGNVKILRAPWNEALLSELEMFPFGKHDDCTDSASTTFTALAAPGLNYEALTIL